MMAVVARTSGSTETAEAAAWSPTLGEGIGYRVHLPAAHAHAPCATAYLLHGRGDDLRSWARVLPLIDEMTAERLVPPMVVVMPDAPWSDRGSWYVDSAFTGEPAGRPVETALVSDLVPHVDATYHTVPDRDHRLIGGCSMGGAGALRLLLAHPDVFSGGVALSPAAYHPTAPPDSNARRLGAFGHGQERYVDEVHTALGYAGLLDDLDPRLPVRLFLAAGDTDDLDVEAARVHARVTTTAGVSSRLRVLPGGHGWDVWEPALAQGLRWVVNR